MVLHAIFIWGSKSIHPRFQIWTWRVIYGSSMTITAFELGTISIILRCYFWPSRTLYTSWIHLSEDETGYKISSLIYCGRNRTTITVMKYTTASKRDEQCILFHGFVTTRKVHKLDTVSHDFPKPGSYVPGHDRGADMKIANQTTVADLVLTIMSTCSKCITEKQLKFSPACHWQSPTFKPKCLSLRHVQTFWNESFTVPFLTCAWEMLYWRYRRKICIKSNFFSPEIRYKR